MEMENYYKNKTNNQYHTTLIVSVLSVDR